MTGILKITSVPLALPSGFIGSLMVTDDSFSFGTCSRVILSAVIPRLKNRWRFRSLMELTWTWKQKKYAFLQVHNYQSTYLPAFKLKRIGILQFWRHGWRNFVVSYNY
jgi:hypothetical protein